MIEERIALGLDSGSATASLVALSKGPAGLKVLATDYGFHKGKPAETIRGMLEKAKRLGIERADAVRCTSQTTSRVRGARIDARTAFISAALAEVPGTRTLLIVGAERFTRVTFGEHGSAPVIRGNSACAAGTGSFLDQQAARLGLSGSAELAELALSNEGAYPSIASRCSVFAKTDLIHAQAEGWTRAEICDGLCAGLARNIADTLFPGERPPGPIFMAGGVSRNAAVRRRLAELCGSPVAVTEASHAFGALGAAYKALEDVGGELIDLDRLVDESDSPLSYAREPLSGVELDYPTSGAMESWNFASRLLGASNPVEVESFEAKAGAVRCWLGIDVGSTSTKAALLDEAGTPFAGFYTRTAGRPVEAAQSVLEAARDLALRKGLALGIEGCATTGSGRKLVQAVVGADAAIDEITAHARAAVALDPEVDTIIEIGGQDSKFTSLRDGIVVYAQMNAVCAAGTGSFIEEQAARLGVPLAEYSRRALCAKAPLTSDRCTVFMERDLNHLQATGYGVDELLAAALHSVCDNYLGKVAQEGFIGERIAFQGATAKNRALVAAFAARLGKPVRVSRFCHLTGAVGAALVASEERAERMATGELVKGTAFRGLDACDLDIASRGETCGLCANSCRLRVLDLGGESVAFGFMCGRDYGTKRYVARERSGWNFRAAREAIDRESFAPIAVAPRRERRGGAERKAGSKAVGGGKKADPADARSRIRIGLPKALYVDDDRAFWAAFFGRLGFSVVETDGSPGILKEGKRLSGAEYCAPMALAYGEVAALLAISDFAFLPVQLEGKAAKIRAPKGMKRMPGRRLYCNYSQFATVTIPQAVSDGRRVLRPLVEGPVRSERFVVGEILRELDRASRIVPFPVPTPKEARESWQACAAAKTAREAALKAARAAAIANTEGPYAVLVGRPYDAVSPSMNKGIPDMIASFGMDVFFQDMLPDIPDGEGSDDLRRLRAEFHWRYASRVLDAAAWCAADPRAYPVFITCFKCSPDSFALEWFKKILDAAGKPYLILQIDEHDSGVGYETRVEAGVRAFRNHYRTRKAAAPDIAIKGTRVAPPLAADLRGKALLLPNWDPLVTPLLAASMRRLGLEAYAIEETPESIRRSMTHNSGQCVPISIIAQEAVEFVRARALDPERAVLWMIDAQWPCNIALYPRFIKSIFDASGMPGMNVYRGEITCLDISPNAIVGAYMAFTLGGILRQLGCRVRPYEIVRGATDGAIAETLGDLVATFESGGRRGEALKRMIDRFEAIETREERRPKVAIFGDFYSRDNETFNQGLVKAIEAYGGEVVTTTYLDYAKATADSYFKRLWSENKWIDAAVVKASVAAVKAIEEAFFLSHGDARLERSGWRTRDLEKKFEAFGMRPEHEGECADNLFKVARIVEEYPDIALFVQASPAFCCPSIITESMRTTVERVIGVPIVPITYDGTGDYKNDALAAYLELASAGRRGKGM
jgi:predicted CoA-substrate-specific enzyme activase